MKSKLKNSFSLSEWSGSVGDLGTLLPLAFALVIVNGYPPERLFLMWGIVYVISGWFYKVPVSVQPLKAMAVIAIAKGYSLEMLSAAAFFYGILLIFLSSTGLLSYLKKFFTPALVKGIQLGIGLILAQKAIELIFDKGILLNVDSTSLGLNIFMLLTAVALIAFLQIKYKVPAALILILTSVAFFKLIGYNPDLGFESAKFLAFTFPDFSMLLDAIIFLILPQLPLTLGNAVYAANDICHDLWGKQAAKVTPKRLGFSIGLSDLFIGLLGSFPVCHGSGGMGAHSQFGAKTGGATIIIGTILIFLALTAYSSFLFFIPVPLLAAMLLFDSYRMMIMVRKLSANFHIAVALVVGLTSFFTRNLTVALIAGIILEYGYKFLTNRLKLKLERQAQ